MGDQLGRYEILKHLARGDIAELLLARASGLDGFQRHVVVKRLRPEFAEDESVVDAFVTEARLAATLHHQHIVQVTDIGHEGDTHYFAMEYVHGEEVRRLLSQAFDLNQSIPLEHVVAIVMATATALHHAHEQKGSDDRPLSIVHRDVSPGNILVGYDGNTKVLDFGIARASLRTAATQAGMLRGKAPYMSPEQCKGGKLDRRSDVFSLGTVLYELVTCRRLFKSSNEYLTMSAVVAGQVPRPSKYRADLPPMLEQIIMKALSPDPAMRFQTAHQMLEALDQVATEHGMRASSHALASYMKRVFGERAEPWTPGGTVSPQVDVDFDGKGTGLAPPPAEAHKPKPIAKVTTKTSPMETARALQVGAPVAAMTGTASTPVQIPAGTPASVAAAEPNGRKKVVTRAPVPPPTRQKPKTIQIPTSGQAGAPPRADATPSRASNGMNGHGAEHGPAASALSPAAYGTQDAAWTEDDTAASVAPGGSGARAPAARAEPTVRASGTDSGKTSTGAAATGARRDAVKTDAKTDARKAGAASTSAPAAGSKTDAANTGTATASSNPDAAKAGAPTTAAGTQAAKAAGSAHAGAKAGASTAAAGAQAAKAAGSATAAAARAKPDAANTGAGAAGAKPDAAKTGAAAAGAKSDAATTEAANSGAAAAGAKPDAATIGAAAAGARPDAATIGASAAGARPDAATTEAETPAAGAASAKTAASGAKTGAPAGGEKSDSPFPVLAGAKSDSPFPVLAGAKSDSPFPVLVGAKSNSPFPVLASSEAQRAETAPALPPPPKVASSPSLVLPLVAPGTGEESAIQTPMAPIRPTPSPAAKLRPMSGEAEDTAVDSGTGPGEDTRVDPTRDGFISSVEAVEEAIVVAKRNDQATEIVAPLPPPVVDPDIHGDGFAIDPTRGSRKRRWWIGGGVAAAVAVALAIGLSGGGGTDERSGPTTEENEAAIAQKQAKLEAEAAAARAAAEQPRSERTWASTQRAAAEEPATPVAPAEPAPDEPAPTEPPPSEGFDSVMTADLTALAPAGAMAAASARPTAEDPPAPPDEPTEPATEEPPTTVATATTKPSKAAKPAPEKPATTTKAAAIAKPATAKPAPKPQTAKPETAKPAPAAKVTTTKPTAATKSIVTAKPATTTKPATTAKVATTKPATTAKPATTKPPAKKPPAKPAKKDGWDPNSLFPK